MNQYSCKPLWNRYPGQCQAQPAYLQISESGDIYCDWSGELGNAIPFRVYNNIDIRFRISNRLDQYQIDDLIAQVTPLAKKLLENTSIEWDGNNNRRKFRSHDALSTLQKIQDICDDFDDDMAAPDWTHCGDENCDHCNYEG